MIECMKCYGVKKERKRERRKGEYLVDDCSSVDITIDGDSDTSTDHT